MQLAIQLIFAQLEPQLGIDEVLTKGAVTSQSIAEGWNSQWLNLLQNTGNGTLYGTLTTLGIFFAVGTLLFFMIQFLKDLISYEYSRPISALIWPFVVVILLSNSGKGSILSNLTLGLRGYLNTVNQQLVVSPNTSKMYQEALNMSVAEEVTGSFLRPCQSLTGEQQSECFKRATDRIIILLRRYRTTYGNKNWIIRLQDKVNEINNVSSVRGIVSETSFNSLLGSTVQTSIKSFLVSLQYAFQNLIEATMLLIALLGPIAVGGSLLPVAGKPIFAWLTGFLSIGIAKISFNIIAVLTAAVIVNGPGQNFNADPDLMWFIIFLGILAPILSLLVAAAGGFALFSGISNTASLVRERI
ncbi:hypothetical protein NIES4072_55900 [Nostoc commune NIES-4072]|uniref:NAD/NADP transhydrogenase beta subunit n=1 Tax=Nostoc commune NIES-4072 TaxID=2005467 RepID=A0A2R5G1E4_NOSCO|nr:hypothetical protein [Nostoc commune]BBD67115.1 hypothetical protein NIES4070_35030 [Nostoc commune HK-02]GBG21901.1 hypothetical protein NIES4072_55900 [Nostoc commune NIES-4072]